MSVYFGPVPRRVSALMCENNVNAGYGLKSQWKEHQLQQIVRLNRLEYCQPWSQDTLPPFCQVLRAEHQCRHQLQSSSQVRI